MNFLDDVAEYSLSETNELSRDIETWFTRFIDDKFASKVSDKTLKSYTNAIAPFKAFCKINKDKMSMEEISARFINRYFIWYQQELAIIASAKMTITVSLFEKVKRDGMKKSFGKNDASFEVFEVFENTLSHRLVVLKDLLKFITENNRENHDYMRLFDKLFHVKIHEKTTQYLTSKEIDKVIDEMIKWPNTYKGPNRKPKSSERYAYRDSLLILIYCLTGARSEEVVYIKRKDIVIEDGRCIVKIEKGKGGKKRSIAVNYQLLKTHLDYFDREIDNDNTYLSSTYDKTGLKYTNKVMSPDTIRRFENFILKLLNIHKTGLHSIRRGYATKRIAKDKVQIPIVAKELGNTVAILEKHYYKHDAEIV